MNRTQKSILTKLVDGGRTNLEIASLLEVTPDTVRSYINRSPSLKILRGERERFSGEGLETFFVDPHLDGEDLIIAADWHVPLHDISFCNEMLRIANLLEITTLVVPGDFLNQAWFSVFLKNQEEAGFVHEIQVARDIFKVLLLNFSKIVFSWGNHEDRLLKALGYRETMEQVFNIVLGEGAFCAFDDDFVIIDNAWRVCHPKSYSVVPLQVPRKLANKYKMNIVAAHGHHAAYGYAADGETICLETGCMTDIKKTEYLRRTTVNPHWTNGFIVYSKGKAKLITKDNIIS